MRIVEPTLRGGEAELDRRRGGGRPLAAAGVGGGGGGEEAEVESESRACLPGHRLRRHRLLRPRRRRSRRPRRSRRILLRPPHLGIGPAREVANGAPKLPGPNLWC